MYKILCLTGLAFLSLSCSEDNTSPSPTPSGMVNQGGVDGGGGDIPQSSEFAVEQAISTAWNLHLPNLFYNLALSRNSIDNPYVLRVMDKLYSDGVGKSGWEETQPIFQDLKGTKLNVKKQGGCYEQGGKSHTMGVSHFQLGSEICVSVEKLKVLSEKELEAQITALFVHELVHHFGFGELDAAKVQYYVAENIQTLIGFPEPFILNIENIRIRSKDDEFQFYFENGQQVEILSQNFDQVRCTLRLQYGLNDWNEIKNGNAEVDFFSVFNTIYLKSNYSNLSCKFVDGKSICRVPSVSFQINPTWQGIWRHGIAPLRRNDGKDSDSNIVGFSCSGENVRYQDVLRAIGGVQ